MDDKQVVQLKNGARFEFPSDLGVHLYEKEYIEIYEKDTGRIMFHVPYEYVLYYEVMQTSLEQGLVCDKHEVEDDR